MIKKPNEDSKQTSEVTRNVANGWIDFLAITPEETLISPPDHFRTHSKAAHEALFETLYAEILSSTISISTTLPPERSVHDKKINYIYNIQKGWYGGPSETRRFKTVKEAK
jgi:hypothetical protein